MDEDDLAPVIPLRSDEEELELLESAVLDQLEEEDEDQAGTDGATEKVEWLARHNGPRHPRPPSV